MLTYKQGVVTHVYNDGVQIGQIINVRGKYAYYPLNGDYRSRLYDTVEQVKETL